MNHSVLRLLMAVAVLMSSTPLRAHGDEGHGNDAPPPKPVEGETNTELDAKKLKDDAKFRGEVADRLVIFLMEHDLADAASVKAEKKYWDGIRTRLEALVKEQPGQAAWVWALLGPSDAATRQDKVRIEHDKALGDHPELKTLVDTSGKLKSADSSGPWLAAFLEKSSKASIEILKGAPNERTIAEHGGVTGAPTADAGGGLGMANGQIAAGAGIKEQYMGKYNFDFDGRTISVRLYSHPNEKGQMEHWIGFYDITNDVNIHGYEIPYDSRGSAKIVLTDRSMVAREYEVDFTPHKFKPGEAPYESDTVVRIRRTTTDAEGNKKTLTGKAWLNQLVKDRADQAFESGRYVTMDGKKYYAAAQGGQPAGLLFYDADQVKALREGKLHPMNVLPAHVAYTTDIAAGKETIYGGGKSKIVGADYELVYDKASDTWKPKKLDGADKDKTADPGAGAGGSTPTPGADDPAVTVAPAPDSDFPEAFEESFQQSDLNAKLKAVGVGYRIYEASPGVGPYVAVVREGGSVKPMRTVQIDGKAMPAYCCGSAAPGDKYIPGSLDLRGRTLIHERETGKIFLSVDNPFVQVGVYEEEQGHVVIKKRANAGDALTKLPGLKGDVSAIVGAMDDKIKALGGEFRELHGYHNQDGWSLFVLTTASSGRSEGHFYGGDIAAPKAKAKPKGDGGDGKQAKKPDFKVDPGDTGGAPTGDSFPKTIDFGKDDSKVTYHLHGVDGDKHLAMYMDVDKPSDAGKAKSCVVRWQVLDGTGQPTGMVRSYQVFNRDIHGDENPCARTDKYTFKALRVPVEIHNLVGRWESDNFVIYNEVPSDSNKKNEKIDAVIVKKS